MWLGIEETRFLEAFQAVNIEGQVTRMIGRLKLYKEAVGRRHCGLTPLKYYF
jgi:hypothetical protein